MVLGRGHKHATDFTKRYSTYERRLHPLTTLRWNFWWRCGWRRAKVSLAVGLGVLVPSYQSVGEHGFASSELGRGDVTHHTLMRTPASEPGELASQPGCGDSARAESDPPRLRQQGQPFDRHRACRALDVAGAANQPPTTGHRRAGTYCQVLH